jgi:hypothetical protein
MANQRMVPFEITRHVSSQNVILPLHNFTNQHKTFSCSVVQYLPVQVFPHFAQAAHAVELSLTRGSTMHKLVAGFLVFLLAALPSMAQEQSSANHLLVPAGTGFSVVLTSQISSSDTHPGDQLHTQLVAPVVLGSQIALPAGTYLEGRVSKVTQQDDRVQVILQSASFAFANGYVALLSGPVTVQSSNGWWRPSPNSHRALSFLPLFLAPAVGFGIGAAVGMLLISIRFTPGNATTGGMIPHSWLSVR